MNNMDHSNHEGNMGGEMKRVVRVDGMTCRHCAMRVGEALKGVCGVKSANIDLEAKKAFIELAHHVDDSAIKEAVEDAGYEVVGIE